MKPCSTGSCLRNGDYADGLCRECFERKTARKLRLAILEGDDMISTTSTIKTSRQGRGTAQTGMNRWRRWADGRRRRRGD